MAKSSLVAPRRSTRPHPERGAALVEYAFIFILFMTILFGISGFGHALYVYHSLNHAAKEGVRWAAVNGRLCSDDTSCNGLNGMNNGTASRTDIQNHVLADLAPSINQSLVTVTADFTHPSGSPDVCTKQVTATDGTLYGPHEDYPGCTVTVQVQYPYTIIFPLIQIPTINMSSKAEMVIAH